ncbi:MAG: hypothetical protein JOZ57_13860, partial [Abitibacteriaceae bacterium]|nr:hypothetical protein [Abditibacteriaceae bacterium]
MNDYLPRKDADALTFVTTLAATLAANPASYGLTANDVTPLTNKANELGQALQDVDALKSAASAGVAHKEDIRAALESLVRPLVAQIQANPAVTAQLKTQAGLPVYDTTPSATAPQVPTDLVVQPQANGVHVLSWNRNGNLPGTQFIIEAKTGTATEFVRVDVITATSYEHPGQKAGVPVVYR